MLITSKTCEYIVPESDNDADYEQFEFFLVWINPDGGVYNWLFEDFVKSVSVDNKTINEKSDNIKTIRTAANQIYTVVAEDLTENEFDVISKITRATMVRRYFKDGTYINMAVLTNNIEKSKSQFRYNFTIEIQQKDLNYTK